MNAHASDYSAKQDSSFDLVRLSRSKAVVDLCSNTIRAYARQGLPIYRRGKAAFFSKAELIDFLRRGNGR